MDNRHLALLSLENGISLLGDEVSRIESKMLFINPFSFCFLDFFPQICMWDVDYERYVGFFIFIIV